MSEEEKLDLNEAQESIKQFYESHTTEEIIKIFQDAGIEVKPQEPRDE